MGKDLLFESRTILLVSVSSFMGQKKGRLEPEGEIIAENRGNRQGARLCRQAVPAGISPEHIQRNMVPKMGHVPLRIFSELKSHGPEQVKESLVMTGFFYGDKNMSSKNLHDFLSEFISM